MTDLVWVISSCVMILAVIILRAVFGKKLKSGVRMILWALVLLRLLVPGTVFEAPVGVESVAASVPAVNNIVELRGVSSVSYTENSGTVTYNPVAASDRAVTPARTENNVTPERYAVIKKTLDVKKILTIVWVSGTAAVAGAFLVTNISFYIKIRRRRERIESDCPIAVYTVEGIESPFLLGRSIYVDPETAKDANAMRHVTAHEMSHYRHGDSITTVLRCGAVALHWYNPLVWIAAILSRRDADLFADDGAIKTLGEDEREDYGKTLVDLTVAASRAPILNGATMMAGGKRALFERIKRIAKRPKVSIAAILAVVILACAALVFVFTGKADDKKTPENETGTEKTDETESPTDPDSLLFDEQPFKNIMGFSGVSVRTYPDSAWHERIYLAESDGKYLPIAISFCFGESDDHIADIDGDGVTELICNCIHGADGAVRAYVFKAKDGSIVKYDVNPSRVKGWLFINTYEYSTKYDPERFAIILSGSEDKVTGESKSITIPFPTSAFYEYDSYLYLTDKSVIEEIDRKYGVNLDLDSALDKLYNSIVDKNKDKDTETGAEDTTTDPIDTEKETDPIETEKENVPVDTEKETVPVDTERVTSSGGIDTDVATSDLSNIDLSIPPEELLLQIERSYERQNGFGYGVGRIYNYYGKYGSAYAVMMVGGFSYTLALRDETIDGVVFHYANGNGIDIWYDDCFYSAAKAYEYGIISKDQLRYIAYLQNSGNGGSYLYNQRCEIYKAETTAPLADSYVLTVLGNEVYLDRKYGFSKISHYVSVGHWEHEIIAEIPMRKILMELGYEVPINGRNFNFTINGCEFEVDANTCSLREKNSNKALIGVDKTAEGFAPHMDGYEYIVDSVSLNDFLFEYAGCSVIIDPDNRTVDIVKID